MNHSQALKSATLAGRASADQSEAVNPYHVGREPAYHQAWQLGRLEAIGAARAASAHTVAIGNRWATRFN